MSKIEIWDEARESTPRLNVSIRRRVALEMAGSPADIARMTGRALAEVVLRSAATEGARREMYKTMMQDVEMHAAATLAIAEIKEDAV